MRVLLVEDEIGLADAVSEIIGKNGYMTDTVYDGKSGLDYALSGIYDVIVLDIMLPGMNGIDVLKEAEARRSGIATPVLLLTAKSEIQDKITGLDSGADDYLTKPFSTDELRARIRALTRRKGEIVSDDLSFGDIRLSKSSYELACGKRSIRLGAKEFQILQLMLQNEKQIIEKETFIEKIWGYESSAEYNTIEVYISFLRKKLASIQAKTQIRSVRGVGYILEEQP